MKHSANHRLNSLRSSVEGIAWPSITTGPAASLAALLHQFEALQWLPYEQIEARQYTQLGAVAAYAAKHSDYFQQRLQQAGLTPADLATPEGLKKLPPMTRRDTQKAGAALYCREVPKSHLPLHELKTSGSTGEPVLVKKTALNNLFWMATTMREHFWHERDFSERLFIIRANIPKPGQQDHWGPPVNLLFDSAPLRIISSMTDIREQLQMIRDFQPVNLLAYPSNLAGLMAQCEKDGTKITGLKHIWSIGETMPAALRGRAEAFFGARVEENYSSQELGVIATQCPVSGLLHVVSESVIVEVLDEKGQACAQGQVGKVVVTDLHNFATPLIRYEVGDHAEVGGVCPCGRHLPTLKAIKGRTRNLVVRPDGTRHWPEIGFQKFRGAAPISQFQLIQHDLENIEVRFVAESPVTPAQEDTLREYILKALAHPFTLTFVYFNDRLPLGANGKFEEFVCRIT